MSLFEPVLSGDGWEVVPCLATFAGEVRDCVDDGLLDVTFLGAYPSPEHRRDSPTSRHNDQPAPNGKRYVCAMDIGGNAADFGKIAYFWQAKARAGDPRLDPHAFTQWGDGYGMDWTPQWNRYWTGRDIGHCHVDVAMRTTSYTPGNWWLDSLASTAPWGLADYLTSGHTTAGAAGAPIPTEDDMTPEEHGWLETTYNRLMAVTGDRGPQYMKPLDDAAGKPTGQWTRANSPNEPGAVKIELLDSLDGQTLRNEIIAGNRRLDDALTELAQLKAKVGA